MPNSDSEQSGSESPYQLPANMEFEFIDTTAQDPSSQNKSTQPKFNPSIDKLVSSDSLEAQVTEGSKDDEQQDEFFFPLFAADPPPATATNTSDQPASKSVQSEKQSDKEAPQQQQHQAGLFKVTLNDDVVDEVIQSRPDSYYFAEYSRAQLQAFQKAAVSFDDIFSVSASSSFPTLQFYQVPIQIRSFDNRYSKYNNYTTKSRVIDLTEHNKCVEEELRRAKKKAQRRPSLKNRRGKAQAKKNVRERKNKQRELEKQRVKTVNQKKKRGGKKNKKKGAAEQAAEAKPKYRTE